VASVRRPVRQVSGTRFKASGATQAVTTARTNWHSYPQDPRALSSILTKRTGTPILMSHRELILKTRKIFIRFEEPSVICHMRSAKAETNCPTDLPDSSKFSRNSGKRTARPNSLIRQEIILKILKRLTRFREPSVIGRQRAAKTKTNCPTHVFESKLLTSILVKRTAGPKSLKLMEMILKILKQLIRCQQQIDGPIVLYGARGILTDPKACNHRLFNALDQVFALKIAGFEGNLNQLNATFSVGWSRKQPRPGTKASVPSMN
jgi:hypothetical protein